MDGEQFDAMSKAAVESGRRAVLQRLGGGMVGGLLGLIGAGAMSAKPKGASKGKKQKKGDVSAATNDKDKDNGNHCCCSCPPTNNECTTVVCDASNGECVEIARLFPTPCNNNRGICDQGICFPCQENEELCSNGCADLSNNPFNCGACGNRCKMPGEQCVARECQSCEGLECLPPPPQPAPIGG